MASLNRPLSGLGLPHASPNRPLLVGRGCHQRVLMFLMQVQRTGTLFRKGCMSRATDTTHTSRQLPSHTHPQLA